MPNDLRLRILGNKVIWRKLQNWVQTSALSTFEKLNFDNSTKKLDKDRDYICWFSELVAKYFVNDCSQPKLYQDYVLCNVPLFYTKTMYYAMCVYIRPKKWISLKVCLYEKRDGIKNGIEQQFVLPAHVNLLNWDGITIQQGILSILPFWTRNCTNEMIP